jgi:aspartyl-tRNA(Asn)/glutamyl-tRNA(Gln) amidotransferase subunit B
MSRVSTDWEPVIGLEVHVQLATESKIFCSASTQFGAAPNAHVDPVTLGLPGTLPVLNRDVVEMALKVGLALGCTINSRSRFARKHYFYPDLPKGYQISQFEEPLCSGGSVWVDVDGEEKSISLNRIHLEEDAGKTVHDAKRGVSFVDYNRAGVPLIETVSEPEMRSAEEAVAYMKALYQIVVALGVCAGNLEEGNFRCDANISIRPRGTAELRTKVELKNINSFRFVGRAINYEIERQIDVVESGGQIIQETRLWDDSKGVTRAMRIKESAHDYRYFPDPDLMWLEVDDGWVERIGQTLPELPRARRQRLIELYGLSPYDAGILTQTTARADYFETVAEACGDAKLAANWIQGELLGMLNNEDKDIEESPVQPSTLAELLGLLKAGTISGKMAKSCFSAMVHSGVSPKEWVATHGSQITDSAAIETVLDGVLAKHPDQLRDFMDGKEKLLGFFVGQVMKETRGKANPQAVNQLVRKKLAERK